MFIYWTHFVPCCILLVCHLPLISLPFFKPSKWNVACLYQLHSAYAATRLPWKCKQLFIHSFESSLSGAAAGTRDAARDTRVIRRGTFCSVAVIVASRKRWRTRSLNARFVQVESLRKSNSTATCTDGERDGNVHYDAAAAKATATHKARRTRANERASARALPLRLRCTWKGLVCPSRCVLAFSLPSGTETGFTARERCLSAAS